MTQNVHKNPKRDKTKKTTRLLQNLLLLAALLLGSGNVWGQGVLTNPIFSEDFGSLANETAITTSNTSFSYVRVGISTSGSTFDNKIIASNPGSFTASSCLISAKGGSISTVDKTGLTSFSSGTLKFKFKTPSTLGGVMVSAVGNGASFGSANGFNGAQLSAGFQVNSANLQVRANGNWTTVQTVAASTSYEICIVFNNTASTLNYGDSKSLPSNKCHVWIDGVYVNEYGSATNGLTATAFRIYTTTSQFEVDDIAVYNTLPQSATPTVATPTFNPPAGTYYAPQNVVISTATAGATIHYTTDGSTPTTSSMEYTGAINVSSTQTLKAIAVKGDMANSAVASAEYTILLAAPVATAATDITSTGFTANWGAVSGAASYEVSVEKRTGSLTTVLSENFAGFTKGFVTSPNSTDISDSLNSYTQTSGWTGSKIYEAGGTAKMGTSSALGYIVTPEIDLSGYSGEFTVAFRAVAWSGDAKDLKIYLDNDLVHTITDLNNDQSTFKPYAIPLASGTATSKIKFEGKQESNARFFLDDVVISQGSITIEPVSGSPFTTTNTSYPVTGLDPNTTYYYTVKAKKDELTSASSNEIEVNTKHTPNASTYSNSGNWSEAANWSNGLPHESTDVTINGTVTVDAAADCNNLTISPAGAMTIGAGGELYVYGDMLIQSTAAGTGSFIGNDNNYIVGGNTTVERYITGSWATADAGWHQISSPVAEQAISDFETGNYDFYGWDEASNLWMNSKEDGFNTWNGNSANFNIGLGYLISYDGNVTKTFTGDLNTADVTKTNLSKTGGNYSGWHLLGNPFASALKWNNGNWALNNVAGTAKIWNESAKSYSDIGANSIIPTAQGFMVQVSESTNSIAIPAAARVHYSQAWYKAGSNNTIRLIAQSIDGQYAQESNIVVNPAATEGFDFSSDSRFLAGYAPQFYSICQGEMLSTNSLPELKEETKIPFGFVKNAATLYQITLDKNIDGLIVSLSDTKENIVHELSSGPYAFSSAEGDTPERFVLSFGALSVSGLDSQNSLQAYVSGNMLHLLNGSGATLVQVYDLQGRLVQSFGHSFEGQYSRSFKLPGGMYIVRMADKNGVKMNKVLKTN